MATFSQLVKHKRPKRVKKTKFFLLQNRPQKLSKSKRTTEMAPRKPNSAKRNVADVFWFQKPKFKLKAQVVYVRVLIPGQAKKLWFNGKKIEDKAAFLPMKKGADLLIHGATVKDLPGVKYKVIRKYNSQKPKSLSGLHYRRTARSKYGTTIFPTREERKMKPLLYCYKQFTYK